MLRKILFIILISSFGVLSVFPQEISETGEEKNGKILSEENVEIDETASNNTIIIGAEQESEENRKSENNNDFEDDRDADHHKFTISWGNHLANGFAVPISPNSAEQPVNNFYDSDLSTAYGNKENKGALEKPIYFKTGIMGLALFGSYNNYGAMALIDVFFRVDSTAALGVGIIGGYDFNYSSPAVGIEFATLLSPGQNTIKFGIDVGVNFVFYRETILIYGGGEVFLTDWFGIEADFVYNLMYNGVGGQVGLSVLF